MGDKTNEAINTSNSSRARGAVRESPHKVDLKNIRRSLPGDDDNDVGSDPDSPTYIENVEHNVHTVYEKPG